MEFPVRHVEIPGRGRALVAARDIRPGETILNEPPTLIYVTDDSKGSVCAQCLRVLSGDRISESACCSCGTDIHQTRNESPRALRLLLGVLQQRRRALVQQRRSYLS
ncbi:hypothetical protein CYMTET_42145 [Cymbomonas tetramitiformis]|uniref:Uncharacterized protein n=1 Tax=Cymbomonas tetramitiformis TaxID=36881 RepID=A0AAE0C5T0_9CHLO|nr:hypothetical protein CYMTET_42145 [Cymbomonas tetramitiformis]